jgi:hypothetical protein
MKTAVQIVLAIAIILLGYLLYESVMTPIRFNKEQKLRYDRTIERLKDIRVAQNAYKSEYGEYTGSFDTLINFLKTDSFTIEKIIGTYDLDEMTEEQALEQGIIDKEVTKIPVLDSLFRDNYPVERLRYVPFTDDAKFEMAAGEVETGSGVTVQVFEAKVHNDVLLHGMNRQLVINFNDERETITGYPGLKVGSLTEANNNAGNWE